MSLSYCFHNSFLTSSIVGSTSVKQFKEIIDSYKIDLNDKIISEIDSIHFRNKNPTYEKDFNIFSYLKNALRLISDGNFLDFYKKSVKLIKKTLN